MFYYSDCMYLYVLFYSVEVGSYYNVWYGSIFRRMNICNYYRKYRRNSKSKGR